jgi:hypothetical protein
MSTEPFFNPAESCLDNLERGPFGIFAGSTPASQNIIRNIIRKIIKDQAHEL